jgi:carboxyl-terminal processing protease
MTVFDFATEYKLKHEKIAPAETFELDDESYAQFTKMLKESGFNYDMQSGKILKDLKEMIEFEGYADITKEDIASLEKKLQHNLDHALTHFSKHVKQLISDEIVKRYYGQKGEIIYNLRDDTDLEESFRILENMERYKEILSPQKNAVTKAD